MACVDVIIPVFGRVDAVDTVRRLREWSQRTELRFIVVDNGNGEEVSAKLRSCAGDDCRVLRLDRNRGGAGAFRAGMTQSLSDGRADFIWLLDDDAAVNPNTLTGLVRTCREQEGSGIRVGAVGSAMLGRRDPVRITEIGCRISRRKGGVQQLHAGELIADAGELIDEVDYAAAASLLIPMRVLREVGPFEDVFIHQDDVDWCLRARKLGYRIFATTRSTVNHLEWEDKFSDWLSYYDARNLLWLMRRHFPLSGMVVWLKCAVHVLLMLLHGRRYPARLAILGAWHSLRGKVLMRDELPPSPVRELPLYGLPTEACAAIVGSTAERVAAIRRLLPPGAIVTDAVYSRHHLIRAMLSYMRIQWFSVRHPRSPLLWDSSCVKNNPFPVLSVGKRFFAIRNGSPFIFVERR